MVNRKGFGPQGVKQVVIFRFAFVWIKWRITFIIIKGNAWLNHHWLLIFSYFRPLGGSTRWELATEVGQWEPTIFKGKKKFEQKLWATITQSIKSILRWKFWIQDFLHEPEVLLVSLTHLVARMGWAQAKGPKETDPYLSNHTFSISPICRMGLGHA